MRQTFFSRKVFLAGALIVLGILAMAGIAAADPDGPMPCGQTGTCNATTGWYGPGMMGGYGYGMMNASRAQELESIEIGAMGRPMHDEMAGLIGKGPVSNLTPAEQARFIEIMDRHPGASNLMINRMAGGYWAGPGEYSGIATGTCTGYGMMGAYRSGTGGYPGMMGGYDGGPGMMGGGIVILCFLFFGLFFLVWLVAGILLILWLARQLQKDKASP